MEEHELVDKNGKKTGKVLTHKNVAEELIKRTQESIIKWYQANKRELPWRKEKNAYHIWISEIMLQQTRIEAVKSYYQRFIKELPTTQDLAQVEEEKLLKLWEGLGYYNRARNLKKAAQIIQEKYEGKMPKNYQELLQLPGIGEYTAGAIASIAYGERVPAVDGNVLRVMSRVIGSKKDILEQETKKEITEKLRNLMPKQAGDFNEGLMELGELICVPNGKPLCDNCPIQKDCIAYKEGLTGEIPVRKQKIKRKEEEKSVFLLEWNQEIALQKRKDTGLLAGMYEFPNINRKLKQKEIKLVLEQWGVSAEKVEKIGTHHHIFSHVEWDMIGYRVKVENKNTKFIWSKKEEILEKYPIPVAFVAFRNKI